MPEIKHTDRIKKQSDTPIVVFILTSTQEKIRDYQLIAKAKNLPIIFEDIHQILGSVHNADETGKDYEKNAFQKLDEEKIAAFRAGEYDKRIVNYLNARGIPLTTQTYLATEDSGLSIEKPVWNKVDKDGIPEKVLNRMADRGKHTGPGVETAPIISSVFGENNLMKRVHEAAASLGKKDVGIKQNVTLIVTPISPGSKDKKHIFKAKKIQMLHSPSEDPARNSESRKISNVDYIRNNKHSEQSLMELGEKAITEHSFRSVVVDKFYKDFKANGLFKEGKPYAASEQNTAVHSNGAAHEFKVGSFGCLGHETISREMERIFKDHKTGETSSMSPLHNIVSDRRKASEKSSYQLLSNVENIMSRSDSIILFPDSLSSKKANGHGNGNGHSNGHSAVKNTEEEKQLKTLEKLFVLYSLEVGKQLNPRDFEKPIIILNHDGSWNDALVIHNNLANMALTKEYSISLPAKFNNRSSVGVQSNSYYDVVGTPKGGEHYTYDATVSAALELLKEKSKNYTPRASASFKLEEKGDSPDKVDGFKVAFFCSASNENKYLNGSVKKISHDLAANNYGIVYGGGDRYTMGAVLEGVTSYRKELMAYDRLNEQEAKAKTYIAGYSTKEILNAETTKGKFSDALNYSKRNDNIYHRMADMLDNSDVIIAAPGGAGTVQEWAAALILNNNRPDKDKKPVVFFNPELNVEKVQVWNVALKAVLGEKDYALLTSKEDSQEKMDCARKHGIYVETTEQGLLARIDAIREEHKGKQQTSYHFRALVTHRAEQQPGASL